MSTSSSRRSASASRPPPPAVRACLWVFFGLFLVIGLGVFYVLTVRPLWLVLSARKWEQTPCVVDASQLVVLLDTSNDAGRRRNKQPTYRIEMTYHYDFRGFPYTAERYQFATGASGGYLPKQHIVEAYPPGKRTFCYVNPEAPAEAVIDRGLDGGMAVGLGGVVFAVVGGIGWVALVRSAKSRGAEG